MVMLIDEADLPTNWNYLVPVVDGDQQPQQQQHVILFEFSLGRDDLLESEIIRFYFLNQQLQRPESDCSSRMNKLEQKLQDKNSSDCNLSWWLSLHSIV